MTAASGVDKQLRYKEETTFGAAAGTSGGQLLRRVTSDLNLTKEGYQSNEIASHQQVSDFRHGPRSVSGSINGELSAGTYKDLMAAILRRAYTAVSALTGMSITIAGTGPYTLTRAAGDFLTAGIKKGMVVRLTAGTFAAGNLNNNLVVTGVTATVITCVTLNSSTLTAEGPIASATLSVPGKITYTPTSGQTDKSFTFEHWYSDISESEVFTGCKISTAELQLPPTGMATINFGVMGKDMATDDTSAYFTSPSAETTTGVLASVNGVGFVMGARQYVMTGMNFSVNGNITGDAVVSSNVKPFLFKGRLGVTGQFTVYFEDGTFRDAFLDEDEVELFFVFAASNDNNADFIAFSMPRVKFNGSSKDDGEKGLIQTVPFQALLNGAGGSGVATEKTTLWVQDSQA